MELQGNELHGALLGCMVAISMVVVMVFVVLAELKDKN